MYGYTSSRLITIALMLLIMPRAASAGLPTFKQECDFFGRPIVNTRPRPCPNVQKVSVHTSIYFEAERDTTAPNPAVDPNTLTATLQAQGGPIVPMLNLNQQFAAGFSGSILPPLPFQSPQRWGVMIVPATPLLGDTTYTVRVNGQAVGGGAMTQQAWSFTTRRALGSETAQLGVDMSTPTVPWQGFWYSGIGKPSFATTVAFNQQPLHDLIDQARVEAPELFVEQRVRGLTETYVAGSDGSVNVVRELQTRRITAISTSGGTTTLTIGPLVEGALFGIDPDRQANSKDYLADDFVIPGQTVQVLVCAGEPTPAGGLTTKCQAATVQSVNEAAGTVNVSALTGTWTVQAPTFPAPNPGIPGAIPFAYSTLRRLSPAGTPVYYWGRLDSEYDEHVVTRNRRPHVRIYGSPFDLCLKSDNSGDGPGGVCPDRPKDWHEWDDFVRTVVGHLIDRYTNPAINPNANPAIPGHPVIEWDFEIGNEPDLNIYWTGPVNGMLEYYDYTANAILRAFEQRGIDSSDVHVGGVEIGLVHTTDPRSETAYLYHASPTAQAPAGMGVHEGNYVCENPQFNAKRSARIDALCDLPGAGGQPANKGVPMQFLSVHSYMMAEHAAARMIEARDKALSIDASYFASMPVNSHESVPDWVVHKDPDSKDMYRWGGYFSSWGVDFFRRQVARAAPIGGTVDARYANGEAVLTTWPPHDNFFDGRTSVAANLHVDDDDNGTTDRIVPIANPFFRVAELMARMPRAVAPLPALSDAGVDISGFRALGDDADWLVVYAHDRLDTGSRETASWDLTLNLSQLRFPVVKLTEYRFDRTHPAKAALEQLGIIAANARYGSSKAAQVDALAAASELAPVGSPIYRIASSGSLQLETQLYAQGVLIFELSGRCGNGTLDPDEACDDGNNADGDCCTATCGLIANGTVCGDLNPCTGSETEPDRCQAGACVGGPCQFTTACTVVECGVAGTCQIEAETGNCRCLP